MTETAGAIVPRQMRLTRKGEGSLKQQTREAWPQSRRSISKATLLVPEGDMSILIHRYLISKAYCHNNTVRWRHRHGRTATIRSNMQNIILGLRQQENLGVLLTLGTR